MKTEQIEKSIAQNLILQALKEAYFKRAKQEKMGETKRISEELNLLEIAIKELIQTIKEDEKN
jgi:hypothetical protein